MKLVGWEQLAKQGVPRWQVHKRVAGGSQRRGAKPPVDVCPAPSLRRTQCTNFWVVYNCALSKLRGFRLLPFQHTATGTEPVRPFLSGKLFQLVLQWCCTIKVDIENSKGQYIEKDKQEATKDGSESTKIQHGI